MDNEAYEKHMEQQFVKYDSACRRCGECCRAGNDPCANLTPEGDGKYACRIYNNRLGLQKTISGKTFSCIPIKDAIRCGFCNPDCAYTPHVL